MVITSLHWFRKGLRLHDNPALREACKGAAQVYPVFVIDPNFSGPDKVGINRYAFLLQSLEDLDQGLRRLGSRLYVARGKPEDTIPELLKRFGADRLTFESDTEPYAKRRDHEVCRAARAAGVQVTTVASHTIHDPERYVGKLAGKPMPEGYQPFLRLFDSMGPVPPPLDPPVAAGSDAGPGNPAAPPGGNPAAPPGATGDASSGRSTAAAEVVVFPADTGKIPLDSVEFNVPTMAEMGYGEAEAAGAARFPGGETEALRRLDSHMEKEQGRWVAAFEKPKTAPNSLEPSTTVLSPYMKFGCLSARRFWHALAAVLAKRSGKHTAPPVSLQGQLLWREHFTVLGHVTPNFDRMVGNPICRQIPWRTDPELLAAWEEGRTGYPFIDAIQNQLRTEGWMHHLARHATACFLTRGDLYQSWEAGVAVFDRLLIDADWSINNANWMWLSCSSFFYQYFRVYSPVAFGKKTDPKGAYIRKYVPILKKFPDKYIYEPWLAPPSVQKAAGCVVGVDYPSPIVDHKAASQENMSLHKEAYAAHKGGGGGGSGGNGSMRTAKSGGAKGAGKRKSEGGGESLSSGKRQRHVG